MTPTPDTGGAAYPQHPSITEEYGQGMTLLDFFAAHALQGAIAANPEVPRGTDTDGLLASLAYDYAEAMLEQKRRRERSRDDD